MGVPGPLRVPRRSEAKTGKPRPRKRKADLSELRVRRDRERARLPSFVLGRKPSHLLFILTVMAVIGGMLIRKAARPARQAPRIVPESVAEREVDVLRIASERFRTDCRRYPTTQEGLDALLHDPGLPGWRGPYIKLLRPDPWKTPYVYKEENGLITLLSCGPDRLDGTEDDIIPELQETGH